MPKRRNHIAYAAISQIVLAGYLLELLLGTHLPPGTPVLSTFEGFDKVCHFSAYAILAGLLATTWQFAAGELTSRHLGWTWIGVAVFGALDEITQIPVGRDCSFWDWTADASGAAVGLLVFVWVRYLIAGPKQRAYDSQK